MLIGIIAAASLRLTPYAFYYMELLDELGLNYEVVVPDRYEGLGEGYRGKLRVLPWDPRRRTALNYIHYAEAVKKTAVGTNDFLIILTTQMGVFCYPWLKKCYHKRYILDIRDYTHENIPPYFALEKRAVRASALNVVSSRRFQAFLPRGTYLPCHNITTPLEPSPFRLKKAEDRVVIGYVGAVAYEVQCRRLMELVSQDERFEFHFYGSGRAEPALRAYAETLAEPRICFFGPYKGTEKGSIIQKVDVLFNLYGSGTPLLDTALSNKLYDALYYHKPLLTCPGTFMSEMGGELACPLDLGDPSALDRLWDWYQALDGARADAFAERQYAALAEEHRRTGEVIKGLLRQVTASEKGERTP